jgi:hypothetical protein
MRKRATVTTLAPGLRSAWKGKRRLVPFGSPLWAAVSRKVCPLTATRAREGRRSVRQRRLVPGWSGARRVERKIAPRWLEML